MYHIQRKQLPIKYPISIARTPVRHSLLFLIDLALWVPRVYLCTLHVYHTPMSMIAGYAMYNNNSILFLKMGAELRKRRNIVHA